MSIADRVVFLPESPPREGGGGPSAGKVMDTFEGVVRRRGVLPGVRPREPTRELPRDAPRDAPRGVLPYTASHITHQRDRERERETRAE